MGKNRVLLLGVRGSLPVSGADFARYGCATTCFLLELDGQFLLVDGGSGLLRLSGPVLEEALCAAFSASLSLLFEAPWLNQK